MALLIYEGFRSRSSLPVPPARQTGRHADRTCEKNNRRHIVDAFVKSRISPPLVGGDKGEGDITS